MRTPSNPTHPTENVFTVILFSLPALACPGASIVSNGMSGTAVGSGSWVGPEKMFAFMFIWVHSCQPTLLGDANVDELYTLTVPSATFAHLPHRGTLNLTRVVPATVVNS